MERNLTISKFRNIGLNNPERIVLNYSVKKGHLGGLITIIGPNNTGKSNYLDALETFKAKKFNEYDVTNLSYENDDLIPELVFEVMDGNDVYRYGFNKNGEETISYPNQPTIIISESFKMELSKLEEFFEKFYGYSGDINEILRQWDSIDEKKLINMIKDFIEDVKYGYRSNGAYRNIFDTFSDTFPNSQLINLIKTESTSKLDSICNIFRKKYGYEFIPNIIRYKETQISNVMLETTYNQMENNTFFKSLLKAVEIKPESIKNAHAQFQKTRSKVFLDKLCKQINKKLEKVTNRFNKLYYLDTVKYNFEIDLESEKIFFKMCRGEDPIVIERQSTGFRWFFNLYFNFLCSYDLKPGDIIISDEFATSLHPEGQKELRKIIKEFGKKNDVLFVIATQSPFFADVDYFDELRVVSLDSNYAKMNNSFTSVDHDDPDSLLPIKKSFTIGNHVLYDYDTVIVFVEGITDYNYFTMFKNLIGYNKIAFLPIEGVGKDEEQRKNIIKRLLDIRSHNSILLVDGDKAGQAMVNTCKGTGLDAISLSEIDSSFVEIESVFSKADKEKFNISLKSSGNSSILKNDSIIDDFDKTTISNFKKIIDTLHDR